MASIIENLNSVITTKNQLNTILKENGQPGSEVFSEYPEQFRAAIAGAGTNEEAVNSYISSYLDTYNYINSDSLSAYNFIDADELSAMGYITSSDIPEVDLSSYVTYDYLSAQGYVTSVPAIDENIVPKEGNAYTLGSATYMYYRAYTGRIAGDGSGLWIDTGTNHRYYAGSTAFRPYTDNQYSLGTNGNQWSYTYTKHLVLDGTDIQDLINSSECPTYSYISDNYITQDELSANSYLTEHQSLANYPTYAAISDMGYVTSVDVSAMGYITMGDVSNCGYITTADIPEVDLSSYVTKAELSAQSYLTQHQDISGKADKSELNAYTLPPSLSNITYTGPFRFCPYGIGINDSTGVIYPTNLTYSATVSSNVNAWASTGTVRNYVNGTVAYYVAKSCFSFDSTTNTLTITVS